MFGIYIHIPFCRKACHYCDFHFSTSLNYMDEMVDAICKEIALKADRVSGTAGSIYFGGGTPSILPATALQKIFQTLEKHFDIATGAEITLEANPDDLNAAALKTMRALPVNRFSIGVQSFFEEDLRWMNRAHHAGEAIDSIRRSQDAGFENLSIDLIYGYPLLSDEKWESNLATAISLQVPHLSSYSLTVEPRTALAAAIEKRKEPAPTDAQSAEQFRMLMARLQSARFEHYEISNFALPGQYAVHNTNYWRGVPYLGIGPSAHGFDGHTRYMNMASNATYMQALLRGQLAEERELLTDHDRYNEYVMTSLRTMWGLDPELVISRFGRSYHDYLHTALGKLGSNDWLISGDGKIKLTTEGKLYADHIASELFKVDEE
ncbi:coproporphyrinogen III oxidase [Pedobacter yulinensis]|uniref:Heme chaperone HemW n=1 Tax=Pedobacter yulinensis TaxID=2126353 RepID=A0A2T3HNQ9_9SPHI|nr:radical SAM family heme chaperone HemW [Pedobacter yulinensis]PST84088.1 coproporphyrinogen III oxidase [Pedobacter yulinensis]